jgi:hypothetical protein
MDCKARIRATGAQKQWLQDRRWPDHIKAGDRRIGRQSKLHALEEFLRTVVAAHAIDGQCDHIRS